jgi:hypothetical protein
MLASSPVPRVFLGPQGYDEVMDCMTREVLRCCYYLVHFGFFSQNLQAALDTSQQNAGREGEQQASELVRYYVARIHALEFFDSGRERQRPLHISSEPSALQIRLLLQPLSLLINLASDVAGNDHLERLCLPGGEVSASHKAVLVECKLWACSILDLIGNVRLNLEIRAALRTFEREVGCGRRFDEFAVGRPQANRDAAGHLDMISNLGSSAQADLQAQHASFSIMESELSPALLDLLTNELYTEENLASKALRLFIRISSTTELALSLKHIQLLLDPRSVYIYQQIEAKSVILRDKSRRFVFLKTKVDEHFFRIKQEAERRETRQIVERSGMFDAPELPAIVDTVPNAEKLLTGMTDLGKMLVDGFMLNLTHAGDAPDQKQVNSLQLTSQWGHAGQGQVV